MVLTLLPTLAITRFQETTNRLTVNVWYPKYYNSPCKRYSPHLFKNALPLAFQYLLCIFFEEKKIYCMLLFFLSFFLSFCFFFFFFFFNNNNETKGQRIHKNWSIFIAPRRRRTSTSFSAQFYFEFVYNLGQPVFLSTILDVILCRKRCGRDTAVGVEITRTGRQ